jgi:hypothetical protein
MNQDMVKLLNDFAPVIYLRQVKATLGFQVAKTDQFFYSSLEEYFPSSVEYMFPHYQVSSRAAWGANRASS